MKEACHLINYKFWRPPCTNGGHWRTFQTSFSAIRPIFPLYSLHFQNFHLLISLYILTLKLHYTTFFKYSGRSPRPYRGKLSLTMNMYIKLCVWSVIIYFVILLLSHILSTGEIVEIHLPVKRLLNSVISPWSSNCWNSPPTHI